MDMEQQTPIVFGEINPTFDQDMSAHSSVSRPFRRLGEQLAKQITPEEAQRHLEEFAAILPKETMDRMKAKAVEAIAKNCASLGRQNLLSAS